MPGNVPRAAAGGLLAFMFFMAGGAALRESATVDEISHVGAGLSYLQRFDLRLNPEHPPLGKALAALPLVVRGTHADYSSTAWDMASDFFASYGMEWIFGDAVLGRWNAWKPTLIWARVPMLLMTLLLGWIIFRYANRLGGPQGGLLCLAAYVTTPAFLVFGPLVITDLPVTLFTLLALWRLGEIWDEPSSHNALLFGFALAAALLSKFTGLLILAVILLLFLQTRFWPAASEPRGDERKPWRRARRRCIARGVLWAGLFVYGFYFVLSWNQPDSALNRVGSGTWAFLLRRPLMPIWLYIRGLLLMLVTGSRPTFLLGHSYTHGVPHYFPIIFALKSTLGFLLLLLLGAISAVAHRRLAKRVISADVRPHWRVLMLGFFVFLAVCIFSRLNISIRHFMVPIVILILMLAPLPRILTALPYRRILKAMALLCVLGCFVPVISAYPYLFPFVNSFAMGRPTYFVVNDSNVTWNEALPEVERFAREHHLNEIALDSASLGDPALVVPQARLWDCQAPADTDAGQWVAVTAISILENRNCGYLERYPHQKLAGGAFYVFKLPAPIPAAGTPGGPPLPSQRRQIWAMPFDIRGWVVNVERHPERLRPEMDAVIKRFQQQQPGGRPGK